MREVSGERQNSAHLGESDTEREQQVGAVASKVDAAQPHIFRDCQGNGRAMGKRLNKPANEELQKLLREQSSQRNYEFMKQSWVALHPGATTQEYERAMFEIARICKV